LGASRLILNSPASIAAFSWAAVMGAGGVSSAMGRVVWYEVSVARGGVTPALGSLCGDLPTQQQRIHRCPLLPASDLDDHHDGS
jgi:hypothetical protein